MREIFTPDQVRTWTEENFNKLNGKYVCVELAASEWYKENVPDGGDWEGGAGPCIDAGLRPAYGEPRDSDPVVRYVHWDYGMGCSWLVDATVYVSVCDEHGEHRVSFDIVTSEYRDNGDPGAAECLRTLGVRGRDPNDAEQEGTSGKEESSQEQD